MQSSGEGGRARERKREKTMTPNWVKERALERERDSDIFLARVKRRMPPMLDVGVCSTDKE